MIDINALKKRYVNRTVLDITSHIFQEGRNCAIIGPNGSGKSTLLRILAGAIESDEGTFIIAPDIADSMAYMPQKPYAFGFTVLQNVKMACLDEQNANDLAMNALKKVGLEDLAHARGNRLSGGEAQRMALARMIAKPHRLLLLDEPTSSTDIAGTERIEEALLRYSKETCCTLIFATHSPAQVLKLAQDVVMLNHGLIVETGPVSDVLFRPQKQTTKNFLRHWQLAPTSNEVFPIT